MAEHEHEHEDEELPSIDHDPLTRKLWGKYLGRLDKLFIIKLLIQMKR